MWNEESNSILIDNDFLHIVNYCFALLSVQSATLVKRIQSAIMIIYIRPDAKHFAQINFSNSLEIRWKRFPVCFVASGRNGKRHVAVEKWHKNLFEMLRANSVIRAVIDSNLTAFPNDKLFPASLILRLQFAAKKTKPFKCLVIRQVLRLRGD